MSAAFRSTAGGANHPRTGCCPARVGTSTSNLPTPASCLTSDPGVTILSANSSRQQLAVAWSQQQHNMAALLASFAAPLARLKVEPRVARPIFHLAPTAPRGWINDPNGAQQQHNTCSWTHADAPWHAAWHGSAVCSLSLRQQTAFELLQSAVYCAACCVRRAGNSLPC